MPKDRAVFAQKLESNVSIAKMEEQNPSRH